MSQTPDISGQVVFIACCAPGGGGNRWLNGDTAGGGVGTTENLPSEGVDVTGTMWRAQKTAGGYTFSNLGRIPNANHQLLGVNYVKSGRIPKWRGNPVLVADGNATSTWIVVSRPTVDYYPHQPWGGVVQGTMNYTYFLENPTGLSESKPGYLSASVGDTSGLATMVDVPTSPGASWMVLVAAGVAL